MSFYIVAESKKYNTMYISKNIWEDRACKFLYKKGFVFKLIKEKELHNEGFVVLHHICKTKVVLSPKIHTINYKFPIIRNFNELCFHLNHLQRKPKE